MSEYFHWISNAMLFAPKDGGIAPPSSKTNLIRRFPQCCDANCSQSSNYDSTRAGYRPKLRSFKESSTHLGRNIISPAFNKCISTGHM